MSETEELIRRTFVELYAGGAGQRLTVRELCRQIPIARTTFYLYYADLDAVQQAVEQELIDGISAASAGLYGPESAAAFYRTMDYIRQHRRGFYAFLVAQPNARFLAGFKAAIIAHARSHFSKSRPNLELELEIFASAVLGCYTYWLSHPDRVDVQQLGTAFAYLKSVLENQGKV